MMHGQKNIKLPTGRKLKITESWSPLSFLIGEREFHSKKISRARFHQAAYTPYL